MCNGGRVANISYSSRHIVICCCTSSSILLWVVGQFTHCGKYLDKWQKHVVNVTRRIGKHKTLMPKIENGDKESTD
jgi:hypothetical protein